MAINNTKTYLKETVGAQYICFATSSESTEFDGTYEVDVEKTEVVKSVGVSENTESTPVRASGKDFAVVSSSSGTEISVEVIAFVEETLAKMRGDIIDETGLIITNANPVRPYFAYGKVVVLKNGKYRWEWFPKCQLTANTDDTKTSEETFSEQNDTITIKAMVFDDKNNVKTKISTDFKLPVGLTEEKFFSKPILNASDLSAILGTESK